MNSVLYTLTILLVLLIVLLTVPMTVAFRVTRSKEIKGQVIVHWLFGLVRFPISIPCGTKAEQKRRRKARDRRGKRKRNKKVRGILTVLQQAPFRRRIMRFIKGLLHAAHARELYLRLRIGLDDPADTGRLWGVLGPAAGIAADLRCAEVRIEPEFTDPVLEVEGHGKFHLIPLQFIGLAAAFVVSPATLHALFTLRRRNA